MNKGFQNWSGFRYKQQGCVYVCACPFVCVHILLRKHAEQKNNTVGLTLISKNCKLYKIKLILKKLKSKRQDCRNKTQEHFSSAEFQGCVSSTSALLKELLPKILGHYMAFVFGFYFGPMWQPLATKGTNRLIDIAEGCKYHIMKNPVGSCATFPFH